MDALNIDQWKDSDGDYVDSNGTHHDTPCDFILTGIFGFCSCGDPESVLEYLHAVLTFLDSPGPKHQGRDDLFANDGARTFVWYVLDKCGITEHGVCVPGWLTDKGKAVLHDLNILSRDEVTH